MLSVLGTLAINAQQQLVIVSQMASAVTAGPGDILAPNPSVGHRVALTRCSHEPWPQECDSQVEFSRVTVACRPSGPRAGQSDYFVRFGHGLLLFSPIQRLPSLGYG